MLEDAVGILWHHWSSQAVKSLIVYKALVQIGAIYDLEGTLKDFIPEE